MGTAKMTKTVAQVTYGIRRVGSLHVMTKGGTQEGIPPKTIGKRQDGGPH